VDHHAFDVRDGEDGEQEERFHHVVLINNY
jgi:hypothetical protein